VKWLPGKLILKLVAVSRIVALGSLELVSLEALERIERFRELW